jgi:cation diffusion facilitator CzcD-associated flavoprotein CzcO
VVGCGNSGAEIAIDLAERRIDVAMVVRGPVHVVPRDLFGRPSQETSIRLSRLPGAVRDAIVSPILRMATGYRPGLDRFIDRFAPISDERGRPHRFGEETGVPGLFFVGFRNPPTGALREIAGEAPRVATAIRARR